MDSCSSSSCSSCRRGPTRTCGVCSARPRGAERMPILLEVRNLGKRFGGLHAVQDLTFSLSEGETVALIGPNGAGKTTVFGLLSGFLTPDAGAIRFRGRSIVGLKPHAVCALGLARTFQIARPFPH